MIKFIADIGSNHNNHIGRIEQLIKHCKRIGCYGVKFQLFKADKMYAPGHIPEGLKENELNENFIPIIADICKKEDIKFGCTPFYNEAVDILEPYVDFFKISSYEILRHDLIRKCAETNRPLHISTGMATDEEIENALRDIHTTSKIILYHCCAEYPAPFKKCDIQRMQNCIPILNTQNPDNNFKVLNCYEFQGYSDHTKSVEAILFAIAHDAKYIEFHIDLDGGGAEYQHGHCWRIEDAEYMIEKCQKATDLIVVSDFSTKDRELRADPEDGLRPHKSLRRK